MSEARQHYRRGIEHFAGGRIEEAIDAYREALTADENLSLAWNGLAMALAKGGALDAAIEAARHYVELEPDEPLAHTGLSMLYQQKGMIPEAEEERAISLQLQEGKRGL